MLNILTLSTLSNDVESLLGVEAVRPTNSSVMHTARDQGQALERYHQAEIGEA